MRIDLKRDLLGLASLALVGCCADVVTGSDVHNAPDAVADVPADGGVDPGVVTADATFDLGELPVLSWAQNVYSKLVTPGGCTPGSGCHSGAAGGLNLSTPESAYASLVNVPASCPGFLRVRPGDPESSLLYTKITRGVLTCGPKMPGPTGVPDGVAETVHLWIRGGAKP